MRYKHKIPEAELILVTVFLNHTHLNCFDDVADGTINRGVTQKLDNNPLKGIRNIVPNRTQNQWLRGSALPT